MRLGFIGAGGITVALVTGLCTTESGVESIWVSRRSEDNSHKLQNQFAQVQIGSSNQEVVDHSDVIVLAFLPQQKDEILKELNFRDDQIIVHLLSGIRISQISTLVNPLCKIVRSVPLPCAANHIGPIAVFPHDQQVKSILDPLGTVISVEKEEQLELLSVITALMAPYFEMIAKIVDWAVDAGVDQKQAADYIVSMFEALAILGKETSDGNLHQLAIESMTPGGLNELAMQMIDQSGGYDYLKPALEAVKERVVGG